MVGAVVRSVPSQKIGPCLFENDWNMVLTYIGPLNQKYFGIKHQLGHIISAASSSRLVGPSLLASYISNRHLFKLVAHINTSISKIRTPFTGQRGGIRKHRLRQWNTSKTGNLEWFRGYIWSRSLWCVDCWPVNQIVNCMIGRTGSYRFGSSTE
jgi:hypothetical protein